MLHVAGLELARRGVEDLPPRQVRVVHQIGQRVLQLVAEAERPARLVEAAAREQPAGQALVGQPRIDEMIELLVRRLHLEGSGERAPALLRGLHRISAAGAPVFACERIGLGLRTRVPEQEQDLLALPRRHGDVDGERRAGVAVDRGRAGKRFAREHRLRCQHVPARTDEGAAVRGERGHRPAARQEGAPVRIVDAVAVAGGEDAVRAHRRGDEGRGLRAIRPEHPLGVAVDPQPFRTVARVGHLEMRQLHGIVRIDCLGGRQAKVARLGDEGRKP